MKGQKEPSTQQRVDQEVPLAPQESQGEPMAPLDQGEPSAQQDRVLGGPLAPPGGQGGQQAPPGGQRGQLATQGGQGGPVAPPGDKKRQSAPPRVQEEKF